MIALYFYKAKWDVIFDSGNGEKSKKMKKYFSKKYFTHIKRRVLYRSAVLRFGKIAACRQMRNLAHLAAVENLLSASFQRSCHRHSTVKHFVR